MLCLITFQLVECSPLFALGLGFGDGYCLIMFEMLYGMAFFFYLRDILGVPEIRPSFLSNKKQKKIQYYVTKDES